MCKLCSNGLQIMCKWCAIGVLMISKWCANHVQNEMQIICKSCANDMQMSSKWCQNDVQMMCCKWCANDVRIMCKSCANYVWQTNSHSLRLSRKRLESTLRVSHDFNVQKSPPGTTSRRVRSHPLGRIPYFPPSNIIMECREGHGACSAALRQLDKTLRPIITLHAI